jgi:hypothetical protein
MALPPLAMSSITVRVRSRSGAGEYMANDYAGVVWHSAAGAATVTVDFSADRPLDTLMLFSVDGAAINAATRRSSGLLVLGLERLGRRRHRRPAGDFWAAAAQARGSIRTDWRADRRRDRAGAHLRRRPRYLRLRIAGMTAAVSVQISRIGPASASAFSAICRFGAAFGVLDLSDLDFTRRGVLQLA